MNELPIQRIEREHIKFDGIKIGGKPFMEIVTEAASKKRNNIFSGVLDVLDKIRIGGRKGCYPPELIELFAQKAVLRLITDARSHINHRIDVDTSNTSSEITVTGPDDLADGDTAERNGYHTGDETPIPSARGGGRAKVKMYQSAAVRESFRSPYMDLCMGKKTLGQLTKKELPMVEAAFRATGLGKIARANAVRTLIADMKEAENSATVEKYVGHERVHEVFTNSGVKIEPAPEAVACGVEG